MANPPRDEQAVFESARNIPPGHARRAFLDEACGDDSTLRQRVEALLGAYQESADFLESPLDTKHARAAAILPLAEQPGAVIGPYKLLEIIGEGGMGIVYRAEQLVPVQRQVALKIIKPGMDSRQVVARFQAERQALALMSHPNIAQVLDGGTTESGLPYFVMELMDGQPITEYCNQAKLAIPQRLELFVTVCQAVQHAHQKGIIHRDLKPSNVIVAHSDGVPLVKVIDFGVAKAVGQSSPAASASHQHSQLTGFAQLIGTPLYMSPEQADLSSLDIDTRSDVYSLGVLLYELLTGTTPFDKDRLHSVGFDELRRIIREEEPETVSQRIARTRRVGTAHLFKPGGHSPPDSPRPSPLVPRFSELDWIVKKSLEKRPDDRYATPLDLAKDIERYLSDRPIFARPTPAWRRLQKWSRRNPVATTLAAAAALLFMALAAGAYWHNRQLTAALAVSELLKNEALARERVLRHENFANDMQRAAFFRSAGKNAEARQVLERHASPASTADSRHLAWSYLWSVTHEPEPERVLRGHDADILTADVSNHGKLLASADRGGLTVIWDFATGERLHSLRSNEQEITCVRFSPDGRRLATAGQDRTIRLWDTSTWTETQKLQKHGLTITCIAWSPDNRRLASSGRDGLVHVWDCSTGSVEATLPRHTDVVRCVAWSPDGKWLASADSNQGLLLWDVSGWKRRGALPFLDANGNTTGILAIAFSPDSALVAYGGYTSQLRIADVASVKERLQVTADHVHSLKFLSSQCLIVGMTTECGLLHVDRNHGIANWLRRGIGQPGGARAVSAASAGRLLVTGSLKERTLSFWRVQELLGYKNVVHDQQPVALSPPGTMLVATMGDEHAMQVRSPESNACLMTFRCLRRDGCLPVFSPAGDLLAAPLPIRQLPVVLFDTQTWNERHRLQYAGAPPRQLLFAHDAQWLAAAGDGCTVGVWNVASGAWHEVLPADPTLSAPPCHVAIAFSPRENVLAAARWNDRQITLWRPHQSVVNLPLPASGVHTIAFSPDGKILAADAENVILLWELATGQLQGKFLFDNGEKGVGVNHLAFSPDGAVLAGTATDCTLRLWDLVSHRELVSAQLPGMPLWLQYLPTGQLAVGCMPDTVVWFETTLVAASAR